MGKLILDKFKEFVDILNDVDKKLGYGKFKRYVLLLLIIAAFLNYRVIVKDAVEFFIDIEQEIHFDRLSARDELNSELTPLLVNFRAEAGADRVLYFEFHNSKEDVLGIPFKYFELLLQDHKYEAPGFISFSNPEGDRSINTGYIVPLYNDFIKGSIVMCHSDNDTRFKTKYPGVFELFHSGDSCKTYVFASVPGITKPVGFIVLEWVDNGKVDGREGHIEEVIRNYIPRMNALIVAASKK